MIAYKPVNDININNIIIERNEAIKELDKFRPFTSAYEMKKEIERLNNNWDIFEQWIEKERDKWEKYHPDCFVYYQSILDKMKELKKHKGEDKNE